MIDLLYLARDHDLPPKWDGHTLTWEGWRDMPHVHMCGRSAKTLPREVCTACGSTEPTVLNYGRYYVQERGHRITALRCPDCRHDQVRDFHGVWWDLGPEDYGDDGSRAVK